MKNHIASLDIKLLQIAQRISNFCQDKAGIHCFHIAYLLLAICFNCALGILIIPYYQAENDGLLSTGSNMFSGIYGVQAFFVSLIMGISMIKRRRKALHMFENPSLYIGFKDYRKFILLYFLVSVGIFLNKGIFGLTFLSGILIWINGFCFLCMVYFISCIAKAPRRQFREL